MINKKYSIQENNLSFQPCVHPIGTSPVICATDFNHLAGVIWTLYMYAIITAAVWLFQRILKHCTI